MGFRVKKKNKLTDLTALIYIYILINQSKLLSKINLDKNKLYPAFYPVCYKALGILSIKTNNAI